MLKLPLMLIFGLLILALNSCKQDSSNSAENPAHIQPSTQTLAETDSAACCANNNLGDDLIETSGEALLSDSSIYHLGSVWTDQHGRKRSISSLQGKIQVVSMIFTQCAYACPRLSSDMLAIAENFEDTQEALAADLHFTLFSMDPARDTPEVLLAYANEHKLDLRRWTLLCAPASDVQELAAVLGIKYQQAPNGDFSHSNIISVLDKQGQIKYRQEGLNLDAQQAVQQISQLLH